MWGRCCSACTCHMLALAHFSPAVQQAGWAAAAAAAHARLRTLPGARASSWPMHSRQAVPWWAAAWQQLADTLPLAKARQSDQHLTLVVVIIAIGCRGWGLAAHPGALFMVKVESGEL